MAPLWALTILPEAFDHTPLFDDEECREGGGLCIVAAWVGLLGALAPRLRGQKAARPPVVSESGRAPERSWQEEA